MAWAMDKERSTLRDGNGCCLGRLLVIAGAGHSLVVHCLQCVAREARFLLPSVLMSSSASATPGTPGNVDAAFVCVKCGEATTLSESYPAGGKCMPFKRKCRICKTRPSLRLAFKKKTGDEQQAWFKNEKRKREASARHASYNFDELEYIETDRVSTGTDMIAQILWSDFGTWMKKQVEIAHIRGDINMNDAESLEVFTEECRQKWETVILLGADRKKKINGVWHVGL